MERSSTPVYWFSRQAPIAQREAQLKAKIAHLMTFTAQAQWEGEGGVVWVHVEESELDWLASPLRGILEKSTPITIIFCLENPTNSLIKSLLQSYPAYRVVCAPLRPRDFERITAAAVIEHQEKVKRRRLLDQVRDQNRELEALTRSLEDLVKDRTQSLVQSKGDLEDRLSQLRELLLFMKELGHAQDFEELLVLIRKDFKKFHRLGDPSLAYATPSGALRIMYFRGSQLYHRHASRPWIGSPRIRIAHGEDAQYLANELGRPVAKTLAIPLLKRRQDNPRPPPTLFFEHQLQTSEVDAILDRIGERVQSVSVSLDRLSLQLDLSSAIFMWEQTFDGIEDPVAILNRDFQLLRGNQKFQSKAEGAYCYEQFAARESSCNGCPLLSSVPRAAQDNLVRRGEQTFRVYSYPLVHADGRESATVINYYLDISRRLALQEQMIQAEKISALGHLAGHIAHELNNPLTGIRGLCQILCEAESLPDTIRKDLVEVEMAASRSQAIIKNLLQFAEGDGDQAAKVDLNEVIKSTLPLLKTALSFHRTEVHTSATPAIVWAEPHLLGQVLFNLVKNACQAMPTCGSLRIEVLPITNETGRFWSLSVCDSGVGLSPEAKANLFTPFYTTKKTGEGTGLGLSMSRTIIERFGGRIEVESQIGKGTTFNVLLPAKESL